VRDALLLEQLVGQVQPELVFHLAANASVPGSVADPKYDFETNCGGTFALLHCLRLQQPQAKVVLASSGAVYGEPDRIPILETMPLRPISPYGASKASAEIQSMMFGKVYGLPVVIGRIFNVYGPRMARFVVLDFLRKLRVDPDQLVILGNGEQVRDFNYVSDTVAGMLLLGLQGAPGEAYNIASGTACSVRALAEMLLHLLGLEQRTQLVYTGSSWVGDAQRWVVDNTKIRHLGYEPVIDLRTGLQKVADWFEHDIP